MPHRRNLQQLPSFGTPQRFQPALAGHPGVRVHGATQQGDALVYRAEGGDQVPGLYRERGGQAPELLCPDPPGSALLNPQAAGSWVAALRCVAMGAPARVEAVVFIDAEGNSFEVPGQAVGLSGDGQVAAVLDLVSKGLRRVDLSSGQSGDLVPLDAELDPLLASAPVLDRAGRTALVMDAREQRGDASLERVDLASGARSRLLGPLPAPAWYSAALAPDGATAVVLEVRPGDAPHSRLLRMDPNGGVHSLLEMACVQPTSTPCFVDDHTVVLPLSLEPDPLCSQAPSDLVLVPLAGGAQLKLTERGDVLGQVRCDDSALWVEGRASLLRLPRI